MSAITPEFALIDAQLAVTARTLLPDPASFVPRQICGSPLACELELLARLCRSVPPHAEPAVPLTQHSSESLALRQSPREHSAWSQPHRTMGPRGRRRSALLLDRICRHVPHVTQRMRASTRGLSFQVPRRTRSTSSEVDSPSTKRPPGSLPSSSLQDYTSFPAATPGRQRLSRTAHP